MAQSSIVAPIVPVTAFEELLRGMRQSYLDPDQSKGPLQSDMVVNTAIHLKEKVTYVNYFALRMPQDWPRG